MRVAVAAAREVPGDFVLTARAENLIRGVDDLADTWAPYLTMSESLRIVAGLFRNQMPTSCCA